MNNNNNLIDKKAAVFKALAHPSRVYIVEALANGEKCVCEFVKEIKADISTISKHLTVLKQAGIIESEKRGKWVYYKLSFTCVIGFFSCIEESLAKQTSQMSEMLNKK